MNKTRFNFAAVFSIMVLLVYAFIAFMGLIYWKNGELTIPLLLTLGGVAVVLLCLYVMCIGKESRWRIGRVGEIVFGIIILATFVLAAFPFTNFMKVIGNQDDIKGRIDTLFTSAKNLDSAYDNYANERISKYESSLKIISSGKNIRPSEYREVLAGAVGNSDDEKIANLSKSLKRQLLPENMDTIRAERIKWLESANKMSVWNMLLPSNINKIANEVDNFVTNYADVSKNIRKGENVQPFAYDNLNNNLGELQQIYTKFSKPSALSLIVSLVAFLIMLLPYIVAQRSLAGAISESSKKTGLDYE